MDVSEALRAIAKANGGVLNAADVVTAAKSPDSPLHDHFDWDDTNAAEHWRLHQARNLILKVRVEITNVREPLEVRAWVSMTPDRQDGGGYREMVRVLQRREWRDQLLEDAKAEMTTFTTKYAMLTELAEVFAAMKRVH